MTESGIVIDLQKSGIVVITTFINEKIELYKEGGEVGKDIQIMFKEDFDRFTAEIFKKASSLSTR